MKFSRHLRFVPIFVLCSVVAGAQAGSPVTALEELVTAEKVTDAVRHYPLAVEEAIQGLSEQERDEAASILVIKERLRRKGYELRKTGDPIQWRIIDTFDGSDKATVTLLNSFVSGVDAVVLVRVDSREEDTTSTEVKAVTLLLDAGEWRIKGVQTWAQEQDFESEQFLQQLTPAGRNETQAIATLHEIQRALFSYHSAYPNTGFPTMLAALSGPAPVSEAAAKPESSREVDEGDQGGEGSGREPPQYAHILDPDFMQSPAVKNGYEFNYKLIDSGAGGVEGSFQVTATPVQFGKSGNRSFFMDQTSVIRFTRENREANENDEFLNAEYYRR